MSHADSAFTGKIPELYDRLMGPMLFHPYAAEMARRLRWLTAGHVLETAAGTGIVTRAMAAALPPAVAITATDLNQPMLDHAAAQPGAERASSGGRRMRRRCRFRRRRSTPSSASSASCSLPTRLPAIARPCAC